MPRKVSLTCAVAVAILFCAISTSSAVTIVKQWPAIPGGPPLYFVEGVAFGQGALYYTNSEKLFELDWATGAEIRSVAVSGYINDLEWVNGELWGARVSPPSIVRFNPSTFAELGSYDTSTIGIPEGLAFDGSVALFSTDGPPAMVYELNPGTGAISGGRPSVAFDPEALAYSDGVLWEGGKDEARIHKVNRYTGTEITYFATPGADTHGLAAEGQYLFATCYETATIYEFDVSDVKVSPTLTYVPATGYQTDGVNPDSGSSTTLFDFRVLYTDADNDSPSFVMVNIRQNGTPITGSPFIMGNTGDYTYYDGAVFSFPMQLPAAPNYTYNFTASDRFGNATGIATLTRSGPVVSDLPPTLAWAGSSGYTSDGVEPDVGDANSTLFQFKVLYSGTVPAEYVRLNILRDGVPLPNSPMAMTTTDDTPYNGAIYTFERPLPRSRGYTYYFEAYNGKYSATGPPTSASTGPMVGNRAPVLDWTGAPGYESDGVDPDVGSGGEDFRFQVLYKDADNDAPTAVELHIARSGVELGTSPIALTRVPGSRYRKGVVYRGTAQLFRGKTYSYWFTASDGYAAAAGPATATQAGPVVNAPPYLEWLSQGNWLTDGVKPDQARGRTACDFRIRYRDLDGDAPTQVTVEIRRYQTVLSRSPFTMNRYAGAEPAQGELYKRTVWLGPGTYWYRFAARDGFSDARGVPTKWKKGPIIQAVSAAQITSVAAVPAGAGAQLSFTLSSPAAVTAEVLNLAGRPVRALAPRNCDAGINSLVWDGRSSVGLPVPDGLYVVSITAQDEDGGETHALGRVYLRR
jgi:hypothetical protein